MESMEIKIKELEGQLNNITKRYEELTKSYDTLQKDNFNIKYELGQSKQLNDRYLKIIENITKGEN